MKHWIIIKASGESCWLCLSQNCYQIIVQIFVQRNLCIDSFGDTKQCSVLARPKREDAPPSRFTPALSHFLSSSFFSNALHIYMYVFQLEIYKLGKKSCEKRGQLRPAHGVSGALLCHDVSKAKQMACFFMSKHISILHADQILVFWKFTLQDLLQREIQ